ncbi:NCS2 family permease [Streptococcus saliviloxodontae]|uniref:AGZA family xanthine/uracil permease-like MFS transporter n=1 Tax=Streptococcus saliviloxodontae TaxID=1349416 RepID=A0ABS2PNU0_9STRE|nr:NCS2 family permease [Streptococcus saliviloxodontae]MBM7636478.1 AGZA family xanthine/uracil permease-like MFS transporter [Streptococcus saliviloxodontae]
MEKFFKLKEHGTDVRTEVLAGVTTFFAMSYILIVNPQILGQTGMPAQGVMLATIIGSIAGTLMMGLYANIPYAMAPGMGLNAFFTYTVVAALGYTWQEALAMVFICGIISMVITLTKVRRMLIDEIPTSLKHAISAGIGVFLTYIGIKNAGLIKFSIDPGTYTKAGESITASSAATPSLVAFDNPAVLVAIAGILITAFFVIKNIKGGVMISIVVTTILAIVTGVVDLGAIDWSENTLGSAVSELHQVFGAALGSEGLGHLFSDASRLPEVLMTILAFAMTDIFDNVGTLVGTGEKAGIFNVDDKHASAGLKNKMDKALFGDMVGTTIGAIAGTSNVTTYVESAAGIGAGGRTGLTAVVVAVLFAISSFFTPLVKVVPTQATAAVLLIVGIMMLSNLKNIKWDDMSEAVPAFFTTIFMGFAYSITEGIACGFLIYTFTKVIKKEAKDVHAIIWVMDALFILNFISLAIL